MSDTADDPDRPEPEDRALRRLLHFQFVVLSGLFALLVPSLYVTGGTDVLTPLYVPALAIHAFFLWRLVRFDPRMRGWIEGAVLVVVVHPWATWALGRFLGLEWLLVGPVVFAVCVLVAVWRGTRRR